MFYYTFEMKIAHCHVMEKGTNHLPLKSPPPSDRALLMSRRCFSARMSPLLITTALLFGCWEEVGGQGKFRAYKCSFRFLFLLEKGRLRVGDLVIRIQVP
jgi:hypothetical protein